MLDGCSRVESWIWVAHVGYPLANGRDRTRYCASCDRFTTLSGLSVTESEDKDVGELVFLIAHVIEGWALSMSRTELAPEAEDLVPGVFVLGSIGSAGDFERKAEVSIEAGSFPKRSSSHGLSCG